MPIDQTTETRLLDALLGSGEPETVYLGLLLADPRLTSEVPVPVEPDSESYARVAVANTAANFPPALNGEKWLHTRVDWPQPEGSWGMVRFVGVFDEEEGGELRMWGRLVRGFAVTDGRVPYIVPGALVFAFGNPETPEPDDPQPEPEE